MQNKLMKTFSILDVSLNSLRNIWWTALELWGYEKDIYLHIFLWNFYTTLRILKLLHLYRVLQDLYEYVENCKYIVSQKNTPTQKEMSYNHEIPRECCVWRDKQMIRNSEQKIVLLRSYRMKNVINQ